MKRKTAFGILCLLMFLTASLLAYAAMARIQVRRFTDIPFREVRQKKDYIRLRGADIHYEEYGEKKGNDILLLHGFAGSTLSYRNNIEVLSKDHRVFAVDLKGYGLSQRDLTGSYALEEQSRIVSGFIQEKGLDHIVGVGHSMGSTVLLLSYERDPEKFEKLVLIGAAGLTDSRNAFSGVIGQALLDIIYWNFIVNEKNFQRTLSSAFYEPSFVDEQVLENYRRPFRIQGTNRSFLKILKDAGDVEVRPILEKIDIPTLILWGKEDSWVEVEKASLFHALIDDSVLQVIEEAGHLPMEERPEEVNLVLIDFIDAR